MHDANTINSLYTIDSDVVGLPNQTNLQTKLKAIYTLIPTFEIDKFNIIYKNYKNLIDLFIPNTPLTNLVETEKHTILANRVKNINAILTSYKFQFEDISNVYSDTLTTYKRMSGQAITNTDDIIKPTENLIIDLFKDFHDYIVHDSTAATSNMTDIIAYIKKNIINSDPTNNKNLFMLCNTSENIEIFKKHLKTIKEYYVSKKTPIYANYNQLIEVKDQDDTINYIDNIKTLFNTQTTEDLSKYRLIYKHRIKLLSISNYIYKLFYYKAGAFTDADKFYSQIYYIYTLHIFYIILNLEKENGKKAVELNEECNTLYNSLYTYVTTR